MNPDDVMAAFARWYSFPFDDFQVRACHEVLDGKGVLVAAPTGSGKTIVGEFAIHLAMTTGRKCFYTTPIKALSNQKFSDLVARYGAENVGLLTGDNSVNGDAPIVVMTTEVLRNMLYAGSSTLATLGYVVMDEVHYLADRMRGAVWEEVIIHLPESVSVVALSATVSNAEEFGEWLGTVRGETTTIVEERRPVPLFQHVMVGRDLYDLFAESEVDAAAGFVREGARVNADLVKLSRDDWASSRMRDRRSPKGRPGSHQRQVGNGRRVPLSSRLDVVHRLKAENLLPAIVFIFSRVGCEAAVTQLLRGGVRLTTPDERDEIFAFVEERCEGLPSDDRTVMGYYELLDGLTRGIGAHHAGMLPVFKEIVEVLYQRGLLKVVFATETLALGINMPARTVVIEKLVKYNGEEHASITPGEYTQLTGRAGRRGLDVEGHAVVLWQQGINPTEVAGLASTRTYPLRSSFRPTYNMAVNLVAQFGRERARALLESSFAQFQADKSVVGLARQVRKAEAALEGYAESATCHLGDFMEYAALRRSISDAEKSAARSRRLDERSRAAESLTRLRVGDVIVVPAGKFSGPAVVVDPGHNPRSGDDPRPYVLTMDRHARRLSILDFPVPVEALATVRVPSNFNGRDAGSRRDLAGHLARTISSLDVPRTRSGRDRSPTNDPAEGKIAELRAAQRAHPCHDCPDREDHARWGERWFKLERDTATLRRRVEQRTNTVARAFDRVCDVLTSLHYLDGDDVTVDGQRLMRLYSDMDLVAAEALREGTWNHLDAPGLAACLSTLVFESRRPDDASPAKLPGRDVDAAIAETVRLWSRLDLLEKEKGISQLREPDLGFAWAVHRWAAGADLDTVLHATDLAAGDFVRWMKQLLDLTDQVRSATTDPALRATATKAVGLLRRGVVSWSAVTDA